MALETTPPAEGPITFDQAVGLLRSTPEEPAQAEVAETPDAPEAEESSAHEEIEAETPAEDLGEPEGANVEEPAEAPEPEAPAIEAPHWWSAEEKAEFAKLPSAVQNALLNQEKNRERGVTKAQQAAAEAARQAEDARKAVEAKGAEWAGVIERLNVVLPKAEEQFKTKWDGVTQADWVELARQDPDKYVQAKAVFDAEQEQLQQLRTAKQQADKEIEQGKAAAEETRYREWQKTESAELHRRIPELADPTNGAAKLKALGEYLHKAGATPEQMKHAGARELELVWKAMKFDEAQAAVSQRAKPPTAPAKPPVRPAAAQGATSSQRNAADAMSRLTKSGSVDDAVAALKAQRRNRP